jgi:hypothetical protein
MKKLLKISIISTAISAILYFIAWGFVQVDAPVFCIDAPCPGPRYGGVISDSFLGFAAYNGFLFWMILAIVLVIVSLIVYKPWKNI